MADDSKMTSLADLIKSISEGKGFKGKSMDPGFIMEMPDPYEGMSKEEKEMRKKIDKIMTERFTIDPFEGMSEEEIKKIKERNKRWREHLERARERMGLSESIQLLNQGGIMDVNRMTAPLGYANGGPAGMTEPERKSAQPITIEQIMRDMKASEDIRPQGKSFSSIVTENQPVDPYHDLTRSNLERGKELGKKGLEGIKGLGSKSIDVLRKLLGSKAAEAGTYIPDSVLEEMTIEELVKEIQLFVIGFLGKPVRPNDISHLRELTDALEKHMGKYK